MADEINIPEALLELLKNRRAFCYFVVLEDLEDDEGTMSATFAMCSCPTCAKANISLMLHSALEMAKCNDHDLDEILKEVKMHTQVNAPTSGRHH